MATKTRRELEPKWVSWYCAKYYPDDIVKLRCPLGPAPEELRKLYGEAKALKVYRPSRPEVDACVINSAEIRLIEAKVQKFMDGLSKLPVYKALVTDTPELRPWRDLPVSMYLLIPAEIAWVRAAAAKMGVKIHIDAPPFIMEYWQERDKYWTKPYMEKRLARKKKLEELGYT